jgi:hypothetical protein
MPNWTSNHLTLEGTPEALQQIFDINFDFQKILPCPFIHDENYDEGWYDWCVKYWGTKWSANDVDLDYTVGDTTLTAMFDTAWNTPYTLLTYLTIIHPSLKITNEWQDEGYETIGITTYSNGIMDTQSINPFEYRKEALEQFAETNLWFCYDNVSNFMNELEEENEENEENAEKESQVVVNQHQYTYAELMNEEN